MIKQTLYASVFSAALICFYAPGAAAQIDVTIGGHTKTYAGWADQDTAAAVGSDTTSVDILRESEIHLKAEGVADNGLTYGFVVEMEADGGDDANTLEESYLYLSGTYGRVNLGSESGAPYLLQVEIPSADANIDGSSQYIQPVNYTVASNAAAFNTYLNGVGAADGWDYDSGFTGKDEKLTYISPLWSGFQFGLTYVPEVGDTNSASGLTGFALNDVDNDADEAYEVAARYERRLTDFGFAVSAGYTHAEVEEQTAPAALDDFKERNVALDIDVGAFGIGAVWSENNNGSEAGDEDRIITLGVDYTAGDYKFGASYYDREDEAGLATGAYDTQRYTGGVIYTLAPGLTARGSVSFIEHDAPAAISTQEVSATSVLGGFQLNF